MNRVLALVFHRTIFRCFCSIFLATVAITNSFAQSVEPASQSVEQLKSSLVFLSVGRQGYDNTPTRDIAASLEQVASSMGGVDFVLLLGDNFYPAGVSSVEDLQWKTKFENLYSGPILSQTPFYSILGNHDHLGDVDAEIDYSDSQIGSARWHMDAAYYSHDFGSVNGRPLIRVVFLDSVRIQGVKSWKEILWAQLSRPFQIAFMKRAFETGPEPYWRVVASHYPFRSETSLGFSKDRVMSDLIPLLKSLDVDLVLSSNDRFQQILDIADEPLHVSTNGGGEKIESIEDEDALKQVLLARPGFAMVEINRERIGVTLFDQQGLNPFYRERRADQ